MTTRLIGSLLLFVVAVAPAAAAQAAGQVWTNLTWNWLASERLTYEIDLEPKGQIHAGPGQPLWTNLDVTPNVEYAASGWLDVVGEVVTGYTNQTDNQNTLEVSPRIGVRWHILSQLIQSREARSGPDREHQPRQRVVASTLMRLEQRNFYTTGSPTRSSWRFRDRFEANYPLNRRRLTEDGAVYLATDAEVFVPIGDHASGALVDQLRVRTGLGYRASFAWRMQALYQWTGARNTPSGALAADSHAIDFRIKRVF